MRAFKCLGLQTLMGLSVIFLSTEGVANSTQDYLQKFNDNPNLMMQALPMKVDAKGNLHSRGFIDEKEVNRKLDKKNNVREAIINLSSRAPLMLFGEIPSGLDQQDRPEGLVEPGIPLIRNLNEIQSKGYMTMSAPVVPWADTYWPTFRGSIAWRYADSTFSRSDSWLENYNYMLSHPASDIIGTNDPNALIKLSPAEKYDLAMGDENFSLTKSAWARGQYALNTFGVVEDWEGICHGWSAAAHLNQPVLGAPVVVTSPSGKAVTFFQQDIKALTSMLWANAPVVSRFVGHTCRTKDPQKNAYGRIIDTNCFDPNPGTWHLALVNQLGVNKRSFVIDSTYDLQIWNFPLYAAKYHYFNINTHQDSNILNAAVIPIADLKLDYFKEFRSPLTSYVVGIIMDVTYTVEMRPSQAIANAPPTDTIRLIYDLELDESYNVIGGEWYSNAHPDFLWTYGAKDQAMAKQDMQLTDDTWSPKSPVPSHWSDLAKAASSSGMPLYTFIKKVIDSTKAEPVAPPVP